jgi:predicted ATPase with chaperone activity
VLAAVGELDSERLDRIGLCAELGLGGELRGRGAGATIADAAAAGGLAGLLVADEDGEQARLAQLLPVASASTLAEVVRLLRARPPSINEKQARREFPRARHRPRAERRPP